ncbi:AraC family transcriptional regulator [Klebsiella oxytoca]|uniref:Helix-turn-helix domain-containing protein n=1 Tax=Klebsiella oxytoca TaxID=571 RepID=A0A6B8MPV2_KLEOX|nr:AraC family transcriptional regulator [Klebsiella oxytoca]QGN36404.1 helix-turn-helix domain-containing protein [Klebsiella oxytoca]
MSHTRDILQTFWRDEQLPWLELRSTWRSRQAYKRHRHPQLSVGAIIEGETRCICNGQEYLLRPGDLIIIPAQAPHSCNPRDGQPRSYHMLYLDLNWCRQQLIDAPSQLQITASQLVLRDAGLFAHYQHIVELMSQQNTAALPASVARLLNNLPLSPLAPQALSTTSYRLFSRLATNLQEPPTLDSLADEFALRKETLIRLFKQDTGLTPASFINIARIEFAKTRLRAGDNIADVGYQAGFADQSHFHKTFVSYTAATPRQYAQSRSISDNN